jgi:hypothetical protein
MSNFDDKLQIAQVFRAALLTALADGKPGIEEVKVIHSLIAMHPAFGEVKDAKQLLLDTWKELKADGMEACIQRVAAGITGRAYQELAFQSCARVMRADGTTDGDEAMLLGELQEAFAFSPADVKRLLATP